MTSHLNVVLYANTMTALIDQKLRSQLLDEAAAAYPALKELALQHSCALNRVMIAGVRFAHSLTIDGQECLTFSIQHDRGDFIVRMPEEQLVARSF